MKLFQQGLLTLSLVLAAPAFACTQDGVEGFVPENDLKISVNAKRFGGMTEEQFNKTIDSVEHIYAPIVAELGGTLKVDRKWTDATVNAYAQRSGSTWMVSMFGGLARHETITEDGFALVVCHEIGHHIGGAPKKTSAWSNPWASNEGQADYWATLKCLRRTWLNDNNEEIIKGMTIPAALEAACGQQHLWNADRALCIRTSMAGDSVAKLFQALSKDPKASEFSTPDAKVVTKTNDSHPATQCRLDTYFQGSLCEIGYNDAVENTSEVTGTCHGSLGHKLGMRPLCWFKPSVQ